jgi:DNA-binding MarR family transcriptional regulator
MTHHDDEMDAILEQLEGAGLVEVYVNADGKQAMRLTDDGERLARQMAMSQDPDAVLDALLEAQSEA